MVLNETSILSRRNLLRWAVTSLAFCGFGKQAALAMARLRTAAEARELFIGTAVAADALRRDSSFKEAILAECSSLTPELSMKWAAAEPSRGRLELTDMDEIADFARFNGLAVYGHALLWHGSIPHWAEVMLREAPDWQHVRNHIATVMPRYGDVVRYWDVVNEPIDTGHREDGLRDSPFLRAFGSSYIERSLHDARVFSPRGRLMINEYGLEYDNQVERDRRYLFLKLIERLRSKNVPLDGIGLQAHLDLRKGTVFQNAIKEFLQEIEGFGLEVVVTELDVKEADYAASAEQRDTTVADETRRYLETVLDHANVKGVTTWGLSDRYSWLRVTDEELGAYKGAWKDGSGPGLNRGLPLDAMFMPKRMHAAMASTLAD
ncbi:endo-1,4-beta-xylanase [Mesorhizobium sp. ANAO-SY3R2]|uniref:endo-1,4-beta-xylanase n=1 Tax=Mesorhizobium sp. ANAO-SY3R2 TaxID=3166644 RepID=UPI00366B41A0